jgi:hypothetical protein
MPFIVEFIMAAIRGGLVSNMEPKAAAMYAMDIIEEPHKWTREYAAWAALDRPYSISFDLTGRGSVLLDDGIKAITDVIADESELATAAFDNRFYSQGLFR